jgi:hypothetical protein
MKLHKKNKILSNPQFLCTHTFNFQRKETSNSQLINLNSIIQRQVSY